MLWAVLFGLYGLAIRGLRSWKTSPSLLITILAFSLIYRVIMVFAGLPGPERLKQAWKDVSGQEVTYEQFLLYDHDVWRFLWDGHLLALGEDPYQRTPEGWYQRFEAGDPAATRIFADPRWEDIHDFIGYPEYTSVYPPLAQFFFRVSHATGPGSVLVFKGWILIMDMLVCWLAILLLRTLKLPMEAVILYAWNPLVIKEFTGSAHFDPLMLLFLLLAVFLCVKQRHGLAGFTLGLSVSVKLVPIILVPFLWRRGKLRSLLGLGLALSGSLFIFRESVLLWAEGLQTFGTEWVFNPGPRGLIAWSVQWLGLPEWIQSAGVASFFTGVLLWCWLRDDGTRQSLVLNCQWTLGTALLLSAAVMPWYVPWVLIFSLFTRQLSWVLFSALVMGSYHIYIHQTMETWWLWVSYLLFFSVMLLEQGKALGLGKSRRESEFGES